MEEVTNVKEDAECTLNLDDLISEDSSENKNNYIAENIVDLKKDNIEEVEYDQAKFQKGVDKMSKLCGMISALVNVGITPDLALSYISENELNAKATDATMQITKMQTDASVVASKYNLENAQKNMI